MGERQVVNRAETPATPDAARTVFGDRLPVAQEFVAILADTGISHGLIGPREAPRLWDRHVLNCAVTQAAIPLRTVHQRVIDVGSGAGLPGLAIAILRPDLEVHLVEPLRRRTTWLSEVVAQLELPNVTVHQARAEALWDELEAPWVMARAVAGIVQLAEWTLPLLSKGGSLLALKGNRAHAEAAEHGPALRRLARVGPRDRQPRPEPAGMVSRASSRHLVRMHPPACLIPGDRREPTPERTP